MDEMLGSGMFGSRVCYFMDQDSSLDMRNGSLGSKRVVGGSTMLYEGCTRSDMYKGRGLPKPKVPMLSH